MKISIYTLLYLIIIITLPACEYDNYAPPSATLTGQVVFQNTPMEVRSGAVRLELWQHGYDDFEAIDVYLAQNGSFSAALFNGDYKLVLKRDNGPWVNNADSIDVQMRGNEEITVPVTPYFTISAESFILTSGAIETSLTIEDVAGSNTIQEIDLFVGTTTIVDHINNAQSVAKAGTDVDISSAVPLSLVLNEALASRDYIYVRAAVQVAGVVERIYTPVQKIEL